MKIGYPCINRTIGCSANRIFRLASYSDERLLSTAKGNIMCLQEILRWNTEHGILFFRITSDLIPFASHPVCSVPWQRDLSDVLTDTGAFIKTSGIRISMHPDQFIIINAPDPGIVARSIAELAYHTDVLDLMGLDATAKIQLHVGGVYGDKEKSIARFIREYDTLDPGIRRRLVIENDDRRFTVADCLSIHEATGIPVLFDVFHHACNNNGEDAREIIRCVTRTWKKSDGIMMVDYSSQHPAKRPGSHADRIDTDDFRQFLSLTEPCDMDIMLEIKDKEKSARIAIDCAKSDRRFLNP